MGSTDSTALPYLSTSPRLIFFTDFDGTITQQDSNDYLTDNLGFGPVLRKQGNADVLHGRRHFRGSFEEMMESVTMPFDECIAVLRKAITLDPHFKEFYHWARDANVPVVVLSGGMRPIVQALLAHLLGEEDAKGIPIVSNDVEAREGKNMNERGGWRLVFHDESGFGHDKSLEIRKYSSLPESIRPTILYAGDGISDLSAAREADLMFAKAGADLVTYCKSENIPYTEFQDFSSIYLTVKDVVEGKKSVENVVRERGRE